MSVRVLQRLIYGQIYIIIYYVNKIMKSSYSFTATINYFHKHNAMHERRDYIKKIRATHLHTQYRFRPIDINIKRVKLLTTV